jgi:hypothetical protein
MYRFLFLIVTYIQHALWPSVPYFVTIMFNMSSIFKVKKEITYPILFDQ